MKQKIDIQHLLIWAFRDQGTVMADDPPPDALTVYWAVMALPPPEAELIARHARKATTPDWCPNGAPADELGGMRHARAVYSDWVLSMTRLAILLDGELEQFEVTGPAAEETPWHQRRQAG